MWRRRDERDPHQVLRIAAKVGGRPGRASTRYTHGYPFLAARTPTDKLFGELWASPGRLLGTSGHTSWGSPGHFWTLLGTPGLPRGAQRPKRVPKELHREANGHPKAPRRVPGGVQRHQKHPKWHPGAPVTSRVLPGSSKV